MAFKSFALESNHCRNENYLTRISKNVKIVIRFLLVISLIILTNSCEKEGIPTVITGTVSEITRTSAKILGSSNSSGGANQVIHGICWSNLNTRPTLGGDYYVGTEYWFNAGAGEGSFNAEMKYLTPGTKYFVWAYAENNSGIGFGDVVTFSTPGTINGEVQFNPNLIYDTIMDIDRNSYKSILIGDQTWMAENLKTTKFNDGSDIGNITDRDQWNQIKTPHYCWYLNDINYKNTYGALYNWYAVNSGRLCPAGWHIPSREEWITLLEFLGIENQQVAGPLREIGTGHWININSSVTNASGFTALPGGWRNYMNINFGELGYSGNFWSSYQGDFDWNSIEISYLYFNDIEIERFTRSKGSGLSVRCIKD